MYLDAVPSRTRNLHTVTLETRVGGLEAGFDVNSGYEAVRGELVVAGGTGPTHTRHFPIGRQLNGGDCTKRLPFGES